MATAPATAAPTIDMAAARSTVPLLTPAGLFTVAVVQAATAAGLKITSRLTDPPEDQRSADDVKQFAEIQSSVLRIMRTGETWMAGSVGNATYWLTPPDLAAANPAMPVSQPPAPPTGLPK